jgi:hypothetical protein
MTKVTVMAGDFISGEYSASARPKSGLVVLVQFGKPVVTMRIASIEQLTQEKVKRLAGTAGWGLAGAALLGPLGAIGGMLLGGNKTQISFVCTGRDGKKFMGLTDVNFYQKLVAASMAK